MNPADPLQSVSYVHTSVILRRVIGDDSSEAASAGGFRLTSECSIYARQIKTLTRVAIEAGGVFPSAAELYFGDVH